jgi:cytidyltransferase-like protein
MGSIMSYDTPSGEPITVTARDTVVTTMVGDVSATTLGSDVSMGVSGIDVDVESSDMGGGIEVDAGKDLTDRIVTIYCDGVFDVPHSGHLQHFQALKNLHEGRVRLIVGVISDLDTASYKEVPVMNVNKRFRIISKLKWVDLCVKNSPLTLTEEFIHEYAIDYVYHAFSDDGDKDRQHKFYEVPIDMGIFRTIPYNEGVSSTGIRRSLDVVKEMTEAKTWKYVWLKKGEDRSDNELRTLSGYEFTAFNPVVAWADMVKVFNIQPTNDILEVGCAAGYIAAEVTKTNHEYIGVDFSHTLIKKHIQLLGHSVMVSEAASLPFADNSFDYVICIGVVMYFDDLEYFYTVLKELERVARLGVYVGTIRYKARAGESAKNVIKEGSTTHLIISQTDMPEHYTVTNGWYDSTHYFNAYCIPRDS